MDYEETNKENKTPIPPPGFIHNNPEHPFFYPIYLPTGTGRACKIAPYIRYSPDYTLVKGSSGLESESCITPVYLTKKVGHPFNMTSSKWANLARGSPKEFAINMALNEINDPRLRGEVNHFRGKREITNTLNKMHKETQDRAHKIEKELLVIEEALRMSMKRLEAANAYDELERNFHLANPIPIRPRSQELVPLRPCACGPVEMPVLVDLETGRRTPRCYRCKSTSHLVQTCPKQCHVHKCTKCGELGHKASKYSLRSWHEAPIVPNALGLLAEAAEQMTLLEHINLSSKQEWMPPLCGTCGKTDPSHTMLECSRYEKCLKCSQWGPYMFVRRHHCIRFDKEEGEVDAMDCNYEEEWYQGRN